MQRTFLAGAAALACLTVLALTAQALVVAPAPIPDRVATADMVIIGKVTAIEDKTVMAKRFPGAPEKTEHKIASVQITEGLKGAKGLTHVRLGFVPQTPPPPAQPGQPVIRTGGGFNRFPQLNHTVGQEACFFLTKSPDGDFLVTRMYYDVIDKSAATFANELALIKRCTKLMDDPTASLKSKDADERLMTAAMLLTRFRTPPQGQQNPKTEPIDAEQSKLILDAIGGADWAKRDPQGLTAQMVFLRLNLTAKDGWNPPKFTDYQKQFPAAAQQWLKDNTGKYRVQRFVP